MYTATTQGTNPWDCEWSDGLIVKRASKYATTEYVDNAVANAGTSYTEGTGITISDNTISVDFNDFATVAKTGSYNSLKDKPTFPEKYVSSINGSTGALSLGNLLREGTAIGITKSGNTEQIAVKFADTTGFTTTNGMALDFGVVAKKEYLDEKIGDINTLLDLINGEEL
jgi:hypothetical protein